MKNRIKLTTYGFTLIELLAVIIILAIITLIATPIILNIIEDTRNEADLRTVDGLVDGGRQYCANAMFNETAKDNITNVKNVYKDIIVSGSKPETGEIYVNDKCQVSIKVVLREKCYSKFFDTQVAINKKDECPDFVGKDDFIPTVELELVAGSINEAGWSKEDLKVKVTVKDSQSGPKSYKWCSDVADCTPTSIVNGDTGIVDLKAEGNNKICVIGYDKSGKESEVKCSDVYKIDKTKPVITAKTDNVTIIKGDNINSSDYFNAPIYGISGGSLSCAPVDTSSLPLGDQVITCTATGVSGLTSSANKTITVEERYFDISKYAFSRNNTNIFGDIYSNISINTELQVLKQTDFNDYGISYTFTKPGYYLFSLVCRNKDQIGVSFLCNNYELIMDNENSYLSVDEMPVTEYSPSGYNIEHIGIRVTEAQVGKTINIYAYATNKLLIPYSSLGQYINFYIYYNPIDVENKEIEKTILKPQNTNENLYKKVKYQKDYDANNTWHVIKDNGTTVTLLSDQLVNETTLEYCPNTLYKVNPCEALVYTNLNSLVTKYSNKLGITATYNLPTDIQSKDKKLLYPWLHNNTFYTKVGDSTYSLFMAIKLREDSSIVDFTEITKTDAAGFRPIIEVPKTDVTILDK